MWLKIFVCNPEEKWNGIFLGNPAIYKDKMDLKPLVHLRLFTMNKNKIVECIFFSEQIQILLGRSAKN